MDREMLAEKLFRSNTMKAFAKKFLREMVAGGTERNFLRELVSGSKVYYTLTVPELRVDPKRGVIYFNRPSEDGDNEVVDLGKSVGVFMIGGKRYLCLYDLDDELAEGVNKRIIKIADVSKQKEIVKMFDEEGKNYGLEIFDVFYFYEPSNGVVVKTDGKTSITKQVVLRRDLLGKYREVARRSQKGVPFVKFGVEKAISKNGLSYYKLSVMGVDIIPKSDINWSEDLKSDLMDIADYLNYKYSSKEGEPPRIVNVLRENIVNKSAVEEEVGEKEIEDEFDIDTRENIVNKSAVEEEVGEKEIEDEFDIDTW